MKLAYLATFSSSILTCQIYQQFFQSHNVVILYVVEKVTTQITTFFYRLLADYFGLLWNAIALELVYLLGFVDCSGFVRKG